MLVSQALFSFSNIGSDMKESKRTAPADLLTLADSYPFPTFHFVDPDFADVF